MSDVKLGDGVIEIVVRPTLGAGLGRFDYVARGTREPLFRPEPDNGTVEPFALACNVLVPWSNRISGGGFTFDGKRYALAANLPGEPYPIHGNGFSQAWRVVDRTPETATLQLESAGPGPYRYLGTLRYEVAGGALTMTLTAENQSALALPFGVGFHPWLVRTPDMTLQASAKGVWREDERHLPVGNRAVGIPQHWDFRQPGGLPDDFINNAFTGWGGSATIVWPSRGLRLAITAASPLNSYILYSPSAAADFVCFEPVSHPVDAFNLPGGPAANGLVILQSGERIEVEASFLASEVN